MKTINLAIIEDVEEMRVMLELLLNGTPGFYCVKAFGNGESAVEEIPVLKPDIVLVDINLPGISGIDVMLRLKPIYPSIQFMVLTVFEDDDRIFNALSAGASGYLLKGTAPAKIIDAIRDLYDGGSPMSAQIARKVVMSFRQSTKEVSNPYEQMLTNREREVLELLSKGKMYRQIAKLLGVSLETIKSHCHNIYEKLHVNTKLEAINKVFPRD